MQLLDYFLAFLCLLVLCWGGKDLIGSYDFKSKSKTHLNENGEIENEIDVKNDIPYPFEIKPIRMYFNLFKTAISILICLFIATFIDKEIPINEMNLIRILLPIGFIPIIGFPIGFYLNYRIIIYEDYFVYQNFWRVKKIIYYDEVDISYDKLYPQVRRHRKNKKSKLVFKLAGLLDDEYVFEIAYYNWLNKKKSLEKASKKKNS